MATTDYQAGVDSNDLLMSYVLESKWGNTPATPAFKRIRLDSEGFKGSKERKRPDEIDPSGQASAAITVRESAVGSLNFSVSAGTHNDLVASAFNGVWTTPVSYSGSDVAITVVDANAHTATLTATAGAFLTTNLLIPSQFIKLFAAGAATQCGVARVKTVAAGSLELDCVSWVPAVTNAAGMGACTIKGSCLRNGKIVNTATFEKQLAAALFMRFTGCFSNNGSFDVDDGDYLKGSLSFLCKEELTDTVIVPGATYTDPPNGTIVDSVEGIGTVWRGVNTGVTPGTMAPLDGITKKIGIKYEKEKSGAQTGIGSKAAVGIRNGKLLFSGILSTYFRDFVLYEQYEKESTGPLCFYALDGKPELADTKGYIFTYCNGTIMNPSVVAGGPGQDVMAEFEIEGNPDVTGVYGGKTFQIDYFG